MDGGEKGRSLQRPTRERRRPNHASLHASFTRPRPTRACLRKLGVKGGLVAALAWSISISAASRARKGPMIGGPLRAGLHNANRIMTEVRHCSRRLEAFSAASVFGDSCRCDSQPLFPVRRRIGKASDSVTSSLPSMCFSRMPGLRFHPRSGGGTNSGFHSNRRLKQGSSMEKVGCGSNPEMETVSQEQEDGTRNTDQMLTEIRAKLEKRFSNIKGKIRNLEGELAKAEGSEIFLRQADALTQNKHLYKTSMEKIEVPDWTQIDDNGNAKLLTVDLDPTKGLTENANLLYRKYRKAKRALENLQPMMEAEQKRLEISKGYIERVDAIRQEDIEEIEKVFEELLRLKIVSPIDNQVSREGGKGPEKYGRGMKQVIKKKKANDPMRDIDTFTSPSGFTVLAGRSAAANERVSFHFTKKNQVWFHVRGMPGSHVLIRTDWEKTTMEDIEFAAKIAAWHSHGKEETRVDVSYCRGSQLKNPPAKHKKLGAVIISGPEKVITVEPGLPEHEDFRGGKSCRR